MRNEYIQFWAAFALVDAYATVDGSTQKASVAESLNGVAESTVGWAVGSVATVAAARDEAVHVATYVYNPTGHGDDWLYHLGYADS